MKIVSTLTIHKILNMKTNHSILMKLYQNKSFSIIMINLKIIKTKIKSKNNNNNNNKHKHKIINNKIKLKFPKNQEQKTL